MSADLERLHRALRLGPQVRFLGHRTDIPEILAAADLFVFPSLYEGLPGAVMEAMALGLPIIASNIDAVREVVQEGCNATLVSPASTADLASAIEALLRDRERARRFGQCSRHIFEERFTLERSMAPEVQLFHEVLTLQRANA
jgi:glycosyltransferase involved in cell wall biosynthesis